MDPVTLSTLIIACLSLVASLVTPVVVAGAAFVGRIKHSTCCGGGSIDLADPATQPINPPLILTTHIEPLVPVAK
jgi:hypothetical protein